MGQPTVFEWGRHMKKIVLLIISLSFAGMAFAGEGWHGNGSGHFSKGDCASKKAKMAEWKKHHEAWMSKQAASKKSAEQSPVQTEVKDRIPLDRFI